MKLRELIELADMGYVKDWCEQSSLGECVDKSGKELPDASGDTLALWVTRELRDTFDPKASDEEQLAEARRVIADGREHLDNILAALGRG